MYIIESQSLAVVFCIITMFCWGSWANTQKLASKSWRFELFYWDYVIGIVLTTLIIGFTMGSTGDAGRGFAEDLSQAHSESIVSSALGGVVFNLANILLVAAIAISGMAIAFPIAIGMALVEGVIIGYIQDNNPGRNTMLIAAGVGLVVLAILLNAGAYKSFQKGASGGTKKGIVLSIISGLLMGSFFSLVASSLTSDFANPEVGKVTPYSAMFIFSLGVLASNFIFNTVLMRKPVSGPPVTFKDYFKGKLGSHLVGVFGGLIWCIGMSFSIIASGTAGVAISYGLGQGATLIAALWGVFIWKEFKGAPRKTWNYVTLMFICYSSGLVLLVLSM